MDIRYAALAFAPVAATQPTTASSEGPAVLTITGDVADANRGPRVDFDDAMFKQLGIDFVRGRAVTLTEIKSLPQQRLEIYYEDWPPKADHSPYVCEGPTLSNVLALAKPRGPRIITRALDGLTWPLDAKQVDWGAVPVAHTIDGRPLAIAGRGPLMLCMRQGTYPGQTEAADAGLTWALFHIGNADLFGVSRGARRHRHFRPLKWLKMTEPRLVQELGRFPGSFILNGLWP
jgi:hypothetical protein